MLQSACAYLPYPIEVFDSENLTLENLTLLLVILSAYTEIFFLMYSDKITIPDKVFSFAYYQFIFHMFLNIVISLSSFLPLFLVNMYSTM
jgi:hypothetical protein